MSGQHMLALEKANRVRVANRDLARTLRSLPAADAREHLAELLSVPVVGEEFGACPVGRILCCVRQLNEVRISMILRRANVVSRDRRIRDLTHRQRLVIADVLRDLRLVMPHSRSECRGEDAA